MREVSVGENLDQYKLTEVIARSGMASIFKAIDQIDGKTVAIKVPYMQFESDVVFYGRFQREEEVGRRLNHPGIVKVLTPRKKSRMYIAMEYIEGESLRSIMRTENGLPTEQALGLARQIAETLVYMHGEGVVHRDLKPENMLVTADGQTKVMDFGIALDESARRLTWSGLSSTIGTPDYMAPEQVSGRRGDVRTDIYSLGTILYEMLTGHLPYSGPNVYNVMRSKTAEDPQPPTAFKHDLDPHLEEIVLHAIERNPRDRYASAAQMLEDLRDPSRVVPQNRAQHLHPRSLAMQQLRRTARLRRVFHVAHRGFFGLDLARKPLPGRAQYSAPVISRSVEMMPRRSQLGLAAATVAALALFSFPLLARAQTAASSPPLDNSLNLAWLLVAGFLVMFMQLGFAMVETGFTRSKNAVNTMAMNLIIYPIGVIGFWLCGYGFMMGGVAHWPSLGMAAIGHHELSITIGAHSYGILGFSKFALLNVSRDPASLAMFLFSLVFMDTAATIPTGAMAERWKFKAFFIYGLFMSMFLYPLYGNWVWGGGWLSQLGTNLGLGHGHLDFAGSSVVHMTGGITALAGAYMVGPRIGKFRRDGAIGALPGHNLPMAVSGTLILAFGWFGFNAGSTLAASDPRIAIIAVNTMLASAAGALVVAALSVASLQQTRRRDGLQRPARRTRRDHRPVRIRNARGGGVDRHRSRDCWSCGRCSNSSAAIESTIRSARSPCTARAESGARSRSASSPTAPTATDGTASPAR